MTNRLADGLMTLDEDAPGGFSDTFGSDVNEDADNEFASVDNSSGKIDGQSGDGRNNAKHAPSIVAAETRTVFRLKMLLLLLLSASALLAWWYVYQFMLGVEFYYFEEDFEEYVLLICDSVRKQLDLTLGSMNGYAVNIVTYAAATNATWPFVTITNHAMMTVELRFASQASRIFQSHFVKDSERSTWERYAVDNSGWVNETLKAMNAAETTEEFTGGEGEIKSRDANEKVIMPQFIEAYGEVAEIAPFYLPTWQQWPLFAGQPAYNQDFLQIQFYGKEASVPVLVGHKEAFVHIRHPDSNGSFSLFDVGGSRRRLDASSDHEGMESDEPKILDPTEPIGYIDYPILSNAAEAGSPPSGTTVAVLSAAFRWFTLLHDILPDEDKAFGLVTVFENACGHSFTYQLNGPETVYLGEGDFHDPRYDEMKKTISLFELINQEDYQGVHVPLHEGECGYNMSLYPSEILESAFQTSTPLKYSVAALGIFVFTSIAFLSYDWWVELRQRRVMKAATQSSEIISSLFPVTVRDRLFGQSDDDNKVSASDRRFHPIRSRMRSLMDDRPVAETASAPIADLFPEATVFFADIKGFTAWSSMRDPIQVFILLEAIYGAFDKIADRRGVFKVETIGDSYVAVCGLPDPRPDHAVVMVKFAADCRDSMIVVTEKLAVTLGPDTSDLKLRFGLNSGPVTAGVLRGARTRFQLFGDTVNTAARMESNGVAGKIHVAQSTADLLIAAGKSRWITKREDLVEAKGKGKMQTYWIEPRGGASSAASGLVPHGTKRERLVDWACDILEKFLCPLVARKGSSLSTFKLNKTNTIRSEDNAMKMKTDGLTYLDEVKEVIEFPDFDPLSLRQVNSSVSLTVIQRTELNLFVVAVANMYENNPFHNFEHVIHVMMSVAKLLSRIITPEKVLQDLDVARDSNPGRLAEALHDHTYGIASDPLTHFACLFSALIHDVGHTGVPNAQLLKENVELAACFRSQSVAEQYSFGSSWKVFMDDDFMHFREAVCPTQYDLQRFRQLVINNVLATDVMDKDLNRQRNEKWQKAFAPQKGASANDRLVVNRKATIVIEHLIQASDVAHTMQHWHIYRKWNERLFQEMYCAYKCGRAERNPAGFWYKGELAFFDFYVIPLAQKLRDCGVFGVSCDEYMDYATNNRYEWEMRGNDIVASMVGKFELDDSHTDGELSDFSEHFVYKAAFIEL